MNSDERHARSGATEVLTVDGSRRVAAVDEIATEEPLEIRVAGAQGMRSLAVTHSRRLRRIRAEQSGG